jgi:hypothetical protein
MLFTTVEQFSIDYTLPFGNSKQSIAGHACNIMMTCALSKSDAIQVNSLHSAGLQVRINVCSKNKQRGFVSSVRYHNMFFKRRRTAVADKMRRRRAIVRVFVALSDLQMEFIHDIAADEYSFRDDILTIVRSVVELRTQTVEFPS